MRALRGLTPKSHRYQTLGHDPVLGFIFGVLDILRGTTSGFSYDHLSGHHVFTIIPLPQSVHLELIEAVLRHIGHLLSDVATPAGLPAPFLSLLQAIDVGRFGPKRRTVAQIGRWMYENGYDLRHFIVSGITPATIEITLRAYVMLRHYFKHGEVKFSLGAHPKYRSMLLTAHSIAALGNAGKIALAHGNPVAFNWAEWMALFRYVAPSMKYWLFDKHRLRLEHLERINEAGWGELLQSSDNLLRRVAELDSLPAIRLGSMASIS